MKTFKVGDTIPFRVKTKGDPASDNPTVTIYDETSTADPVVLTIGSGLEQVGNKKIVTGWFVPDEVGEWSINIEDDAGMDLIKEYIVRGYSIESIGSGVAIVENKVDALMVAILANNTGGGHFG